MKLPVMLTREVNEEVADNQVFAKFLLRSLRRFDRGDWGTVCAEDAQLNSQDLDALKQGLYGRILARYDLDLAGRNSDNSFSIYIIRSIVDEAGLQVLSVMFPHEY